MKQRIYAVYYIALFFLQKRLLTLFYWLFALKKEKKWDWVVGTREVANNIYFISGALTNACSVNLVANKYYLSNKYTVSIPEMPTFLVGMVRSIMGPILLAYLAARASGFFYIGREGFLLNSDGRAYEFNFLKRKGKKIVNFFCGTDIRSPRLARELAVKLELDSYLNYYTSIYPGMFKDAAERQVERFANISDRYADMIFNAPVDQVSYLTKEQQAFFYTYPDSGFVRNDSKHENVEVITIVHAPSNPIVKGTGLVRAAIKKLELEGYAFKYIELIGVPNEEVITTLNTAHIVVNELYTFVPGLLGIEAMAAHCALLTSADKKIETFLPDGANEAWCVTRYWEIYDNLKLMLDDKALIKQYADRGYAWAHKNYRESAVREYLNERLSVLFEN
ncbi:MAG: hypothetical protein P1U32_05795 [Legionellaceae bacterium]|nr:hypothetical protein [Legionellaceae bacterium]